MIKMLQMNDHGVQYWHKFPHIRRYRCGELQPNEKLAIVQYEDTYELYAVEDYICPHCNTNIIKGMESLEKYLRYRQIDGRIEIFNRPSSPTLRYFTSDCRTINV